MTAAHEVLEAARMQAGMSYEDLWIAYFGLGGQASPETVRTYLDGRGGHLDYDVLAQAINERFVEMGEDHPVPYRDELDPSQL